MEETREILIEFENNNIKKIRIPIKWTVTFSSFIPKMNERGYSQGTPSLRIYGPNKTQMACFVGVRTFRDLRVEVKELNKSETDDLFWQDERLAEAVVLEDILRDEEEIPF